MKSTVYCPKFCILSIQGNTIYTERWSSVVHLGTDFDGVADGVLLGERDCVRVWTPSCSGSAASCDGAGVYTITCRGGLALRSSCCVVVLAELAGTPTSGAGLPSAALDVEAPPRSPSFPVAFLPNEVPP